MIAFAIRQRGTLLSEQELPIESVPEEGEAPPLPDSVCSSFLLHRLTTVCRPDRGEGAFCGPSCLPGVSFNADLGDGSVRGFLFSYRLQCVLRVRTM